MIEWVESESGIWSRQFEIKKCMLYFTVLIIVSNYLYNHGILFTVQFEC